MLFINIKISFIDNLYQTTIILDNSIICFYTSN